MFVRVQNLDSFVKNFGCQGVQPSEVLIKHLKPRRSAAVRICRAMALYEVLRHWSRTTFLFSILPTKLMYGILKKNISTPDWDESYVSKNLCWIRFPDPRCDGVQGDCPLPAYPNADQNAQADLHAHQCGCSDGGGHGDGDTITDGYARACGCGHTCPRGYGHVCTYGYVSTYRHAKTRGPASTLSNPGG